MPDGVLLICLLVNVRRGADRGAGGSRRAPPSRNGNRGGTGTGETPPCPVPPLDAAAAGPTRGGSARGAAPGHPSCYASGGIRGTRPEGAAYGAVGTSISPSMICCLIASSSSWMGLIASSLEVV
ncbi:hypothetical protein GCM10009602_28940 [Nocardiopsis tropica]